MLEPLTLALISSPMLAAHFPLARIHLPLLSDSLNTISLIS